jgi:hypothetical protein
LGKSKAHTRVCGNITKQLTVISQQSAVIRDIVMLNAVKHDNIPDN